jgi:hypothetical protein
MNASLNEAEIRAIIEGLRKTDPNITIENVLNRIRTGRESQGLHWNEGLERKIRYCVNINPN